MLLPWLLSSVVTTTTTGKTHTHSRQSALLPTASCCCVSSIFCLSVTASEHRWGALWVRYDVMGKVKLSHTGREQTERPRKDQLVKEREQLGPNTAARHAGKSTVRGGGAHIPGCEPQHESGGRRSRGQNKQSPTHLSDCSASLSIKVCVPLHNISCHIWLQLSYWLWLILLISSQRLLIDYEGCYNINTCWLLLSLIVREQQDWPIVAALKYIFVKYITQHSDFTYCICILLYTTYLYIQIQKN